MILQKKTEKIINRISSHPVLVIYFFSLILQLFAFIIIHSQYKIILGEDPWFEVVANNLFKKGETTVIWSNDSTSDLPTNNSVQIGIYKNWRPIGYSLFLLIPLAGNENFLIFRTLLQAFIYSLIPVLIFLIAKNLFKKFSNKEKVCFAVAFIFALYPPFVISSQQNLDTWFIVLLTIAIFYFIIKINDSKNLFSFSGISLLLFLLILFRPIAAYVFITFIIILFFISSERRKNLKYYLYSIFLLISFCLIASLVTNTLFKNNILSQSNLGYNLFLGNNSNTNEFLIKHRGDCTTIEDYILPSYNNDWKKLIYLNEDEKNIFLLDEAINFIRENPIEFFENSAIKFIVFWSPLRYREGHWTKSELKENIILISYGLLLLTFLVSIVWFYLKKNHRPYLWKEILLFLILWVIPYMIIFPTARYRAPIEFLMLILSVLFVYQAIDSKNKLSQAFNEKLKS